MDLLNFARDLVRISGDGLDIDGGDLSLPSTPDFYDLCIKHGLATERPLTEAEIQKGGPWSEHDMKAGEIWAFWAPELMNKRNTPPMTYIEVPDDDIDILFTDAKGKEYRRFDTGAALASLLLAEVVLIGSKNNDGIGALVICNDIFAWGCADAEDLPYSEIENVWRMWRRDPEWGTAIWCIQRRKEMPQKAVEKLIRAAGLWDLDQMQLDENWQDDYCKAIIAQAVRKGQFRS
jgi:hypothetical protein